MGNPNVSDRELLLQNGFTTTRAGWFSWLEDYEILQHNELPISVHVRKVDNIASIFCINNEQTGWSAWTTPRASIYHHVPPEYVELMDRIWFGENIDWYHNSKAELAAFGFTKDPYRCGLFSYNFSNPHNYRSVTLNPNRTVIYREHTYASVSEALYMIPRRLLYDICRTLEVENAKMKKTIEEISAKNAALRMENDHFKYAPGGPGAEAAKADFNSLLRQ